MKQPQASPHVMLLENPLSHPSYWFSISLPPPTSNRSGSSIKHKRNERHNMQLNLHNFSFPPWVPASPCFCSLCRKSFSYLARHRTAASRRNEKMNEFSASWHSMAETGRGWWRTFYCFFFELFSCYFSFKLFMRNSMIPQLHQLHRKSKRRK